MKSAYELAMARLEAISPSTAPSAEVKQRLAEVDSAIDAKIAEKKIFLQDLIAKADFHEQDALRHQLASEVAALEEKRESQKRSIRSAS
jgi:hypothetical protein